MFILYSHYKPLTLFAVFATASFAALWCNCTVAQCQRTGSQCETDGACVASTSFIDGIEQHVRTCITRDKLVPPGQPFFCLSAEGLLNIHCCYTDYCNSINLKVPSGENWVSVVFSLNHKGIVVWFCSVLYHGIDIILKWKNSYVQVSHFYTIW